jgi:hypothetical protein
MKINKDGINFDNRTKQRLSKGIVGMPYNST